MEKGNHFTFVLFFIFLVMLAFVLVAALGDFPWNHQEDTRDMFVYHIVNHYGDEYELIAYTCVWAPSILEGYQKASCELKGLGGEGVYIAKLEPLKDIYLVDKYQGE